MKDKRIPVKSTKGIALIALFSALSIVGRSYLSFVPNVQPSTFLVIVFSLVFGIRFGLALSVTTVMGSNLLLGLGPWVFMQLAGWSTIAILSGWFGRRYKKIPHLILTIYAGVMGYLYGIIVSLNVFFIAGAYGFWVYYLSGLPFDTYHAIGNVVFYFTLAPLVTRLLEQQKAQYLG